MNLIFSEVLGEAVIVRYRIDDKKTEKNAEDIIKEAFGDDFVEIIEE